MRRVLHFPLSDWVPVTVQWNSKPGRATTSLHLEGVCGQQLAESWGMLAMTDPNLPPVLFRHTLGRGQHMATSMRSGWPQLSQSSARAAQVGFTPLTPACGVNVAIQACHLPSQCRGTSRPPVGTATSEIVTAWDKSPSKGAISSLVAIKSL